MRCEGVSVMLEDGATSEETSAVEKVPYEKLTQMIHCYSLNNLLFIQFRLIYIVIN